MGLKSFNKARKRKLFLELLEEFGVTKEDLAYIPTAVKIIKLIVEERQNKPNTDTPNSEKSKRERRIASPSEILGMFSGETEEVNLGRRK